MAKLDYKDIYSKLGKRTEWYALAVRDTFQKRISEIVAMCEELDINEDKPFAFADYKDVAPAVQAKLRQLYSEVYQSVRGNIMREWNYANDTTDKLVKGLFGKHSIEDKHYARYFQRNKEAMNSFFERRQDGLNLSQRVWQYVGQAKTDLEVALDLGIGQGLSSDTLNRKVKQYLNNPDDLFRRFRYKVGEDDNGNPIYGRKWKRRRYDKETDTFYWVDDNPKNYHTGQGVYRSSYKNAMRLARTETNMAYRTADITRWQQMEFVLGYEVKLSHNHPCTDICDDLQGKYPKEFVFKGWHPHCYCYIVPILCKDNELEQLTEAILNGEDTSTFAPAGMITDVPAGFTGWIANNEERIRSAVSLPYFITDNYKNGDISKGFKFEIKTAKKVVPSKFAPVTSIDEIEDLPAKTATNPSKLDAIIQTLENTKISYNEVKDLDKKMTDDDIIARVGGGDLTKGSCSSLAFTYAGNKAGLDVLDFRDGNSREYFASSPNIRAIAENVGGMVNKDYNDFRNAKTLLSNTMVGKEYYFTCGSHAAIIRKTDKGFEYLELQSSHINGFKALDNNVLKERFGAKRSHTYYRQKYEVTHVLIDTDLLKNDSKFRKMLGYINTASDKQRKGASGTIK